MIRFAYSNGEGRRVLALGLTDVNMRRLEKGKPIKLDAHSPTPPDEVVIFYATRESILEYAEVLGVDPVEMLDQLGEG